VENNKEEIVVPKTADEKLHAYHSSLVGLASVLGERRGSEFTWMLTTAFFAIIGAVLGLWLIVGINLGMFAWSYHSWKKAKKDIEDMIAGKYKGEDIFIKAKE
jgi:hypothetical protein